jgi:hypothetical protein
MLERASFLNDEEAGWQPYGGFEMNFSQIGNQQAEPTPAMVEKIINSIDAVLMGECFARGIDPKSSLAPKSMASAVETFFNVRDGRLENLLPKERTALADRIHFIAVGSKTNPSYLVVDKGEGQTPASFKDTLVSLNRRNKDDIAFVQGRFNCGGTGVLPFCGDQNYQLVVSRRNPACPSNPNDPTKDLWGFTVVRRLYPKPGHRRSSMYVYLAPGGNVLTFEAESVPVLPANSAPNRPGAAYSLPLAYGTCIKLYNYRWKAKATATTEARYELEKFLHSLPLPFRITETRAYKANYYSTTLAGISASINPEDAEEGKTKFEKDFSPAYGELNLPNIGRLPYQLFLLREGRQKNDGTWAPYDTRRFPHGISFTLNGQVHGELPANFITSTLRFDYLSGYLLVSVDCTEMDPSVRENFIMASRDRVRRNEVYDEIQTKLKEELSVHPGLRQHNALRKRKALEETLSDENKTVDFFQALLKSDPSLANLLGSGTNLVSGAGPTSVEPFVGRKFPSYFRIIKEPKDGLVKTCPLNRAVRVDFETDAENEYFYRPDSPGSILMDPPNLCISSHLWNGKFSTRFQMPFDAKIGDLVPMAITVTDIERETTGNPLCSKLTLRGAPQTEDQPIRPGESGRHNGTKRNGGGKQGPVLALPQIKEVRRVDWEKPLFNFDEFSALKITHDDGAGYIFYINIENTFLLTELSRTKEEEKPLVKFWFLYGITLAALGMLQEQRRASEDDENNRDCEKGGDPADLTSIGKHSAGIARVIIPIVRRLYRGPETVASAGR